MRLLNRDLPPVVGGLIGISLIVAVISLLGTNESVVRELLITEYIQPVLPEINAGEWWRLITPTFLHFGIFHLIFNMVWLWDLGAIIERFTGRIGLSILVLLAGIASNLVQYHFEGPWFGGMSGVIYALFGYLWIRGDLDKSFRPKLQRPIIYFLLGWFVVCWTGFLELLVGVGVANIAHTAGLITGMIWALLTIIVVKLMGTSTRKRM